MSATVRRLAAVLPVFGVYGDHFFNGISKRRYRGKRYGDRLPLKPAERFQPLLLAPTQAIPTDATLALGW